MAHQISAVSGRSELAYAGETPWHGLGVKVDELQTPAEMLRHASLAWEVGLRRVCREDGRPVEGFRFMVREDCDVVLGVVTEQAGKVSHAGVLTTEGLLDFPPEGLSGVGRHARKLRGTCSVVRPRGPPPVCTRVVVHRPTQSQSPACTL